MQALRAQLASARARLAGLEGRMGDAAEAAEAAGREADRARERAAEASAEARPLEEAYWAAVDSSTTVSGACRARLRAGGLRNRRTGLRT